MAVKTVTVEKFIKTILEQCKKDQSLLKYKVYMSSDPEGNSFGSIDPAWLMQVGRMDKIVCLMPVANHMDQEIAPKEFAHEQGEMVESK